MGEAGGSSGYVTNAARERAVLLTLAAVQFTSIVDFVVIMPLGKQLMRTLSINAGQFGLIVAAYTISAGVAGFAASSVIDRLGRKVAFLGLFIGFLVGTLLCGLAETFPMLLAARVVTGAFGGVMGGMSIAIIGDVFPEERRGRATGLLMSSFSLASVFGVPFGIFLGNRYDWHAPFLMLVLLGLPVLAAGIWALPPLRGHLTKGRADTWERMVETYTHPNHLRAFAMATALMLGTFMVVPYIAPYFVANVGLSEGDLFWIYVGGGVCSLISSPLIGRWADHSGKLHVYRIIAPVSAVVMLVISVLPKVGLFLAVVAVSLLMVVNSGRMVAAMAMIVGSVEPRLRGGFMSAYSSVQHIASGVGVSLAGLIIGGGPDEPLRNYGWVGLIGMGFTLLSVGLAGLLRPAAKPLGPMPEPRIDVLDALPAAEAF